jgi:hypothetical protein
MSRAESQPTIDNAIQSETDHKVLTGWALVSEWIAPDGTQQPSGPEDLALWQESGYLHTALEPDWLGNPGQERRRCRRSG